MSLVKVTVLSRWGQLRVYALLVNAIQHMVPRKSAIFIKLLSFSQHFNFYIPKVIKKVRIPLELHGTSLSN